MIRPSSDYLRLNFAEPRTQVSGNDMVGSCTLPLSDLVNDAPHPDNETGLYAADEDGKHDSKTFTVSRSTKNE